MVLMFIWFCPALSPNQKGSVLIYPFDLNTAYGCWTDSRFTKLYPENLFCKGTSRFGPDGTSRANFHGRRINLSRNLPTMTLINSKTFVFDIKSDFDTKVHIKKVCFLRRVSPLRRGPGRAPPRRRGPGRAQMGYIRAHVGPI